MSILNLIVLQFQFDYIAFYRQVDSNKFQFLPTDCLEYVPNLVSLKLAKNPWHCDCAILYLAT